MTAPVVTLTRAQADRLVQILTALRRRIRLEGAFDEVPHAGRAAVEAEITALIEVLHGRKAA